MKFLLEFVSCCGPCSSSASKVAAAASRQPAEETTLLVVQEPRRRVGRRQGRVRGREWRPSLTSISEDVLVAERNSKVERPVAAWRRCLKRKFLSATQRDRSRSLDHYNCRKDQSSTIIPAFAPTPFMF